MLNRTDVYWLGGQVILLGGAFVVIPATDGLFGRIDVAGSGVIGLVLIGAALLIGVLSAARLGARLVPQPTPVRGGSLVDTGPYAIVRHPIYSAVLLGIAGALIWRASVAGLLLLVASAVFFDRKAAYEEGLLRSAYLEYEAYQRRVPYRLFPGLR